MKKILLAVFASLLFFPLSAQSGLSGLWEGIITEGGIHSSSGHRFELYLEVEESSISGGYYIYVSPDSVIQRRLSGKLYHDRSILLREVGYNLTDEEKEAVRDGASPNQFLRKFELLYKRSIWDSSLEGFWQEVIDEPFHPRRQRGRVKLRKKPTSSKA